MTRAPNRWEIPEEAFCREPGDYYRPAARRTIARICADLFDTHHLTPLTFLHSAFYQRRLYEGGELLGAFQIAALAQAKRTGQTFRDRQRELVDLFDKVAARCRERSTLYQNRRFKAEEFPGIVAEIRERIPDPEDQEFVLHAVISVFVDNVRSWLTKMHKLIALYAPALDDRVVALLDAHLAEMLAGRTALTEVFGADEGLDQVIIALIDTYEADPESIALEPLREVVTGEGTQTAIKALIACGRFPETREAVADHMEAAIASGRPLRGSDREPELVAVYRVFARFRDAGQDLRTRLHAALAQRIGQSLTEENVRRFREDQPNVRERLRTMLLFHNYAGNTFQRQAIEDELDQLFENPSLYEQLMCEGSTLDDKLRIFSRLYHQMQGLSLEPYRKLMLLRAVARMQARFIKEYDYFATIVERHADVMELSYMLLGMFKEHVFLTGPSRETAKRVIKQLFGGKAFQAAYLEGAADEAEVAARVRSLREEVEAAGLLD